MIRFLVPLDRLWLSLCLTLLTLLPVNLLAQTGGAHQAPSDGVVDLDAASSAEKITGFYRYLPHLTSVGNGFTTTVQVVNVTDASRDYTLDGYDAGGNMVVAVTETIGAGETIEQDPVTLLGSDLVSHIGVTAPFLEVAVVYEASGIDGSPARVSARHDTWNLWVVPLGDPDMTYDGLAVVNSGETEASVTARFLDIEGNALLEQVLHDDLAPLAKHLANLSALAPDGSHSVEIIGDQQLILTALRGDYQSRFLWENQTHANQSEDLTDPCGTSNIHQHRGMK